MTTKNEIKEMVARAINEWGIVPTLNTIREVFADHETVAREERAKFAESVYSEIASSITKTITKVNLMDKVNKATNKK